MDTRGLLFIPDISGFTRFVNETEIEHSRYIIQELLELLINANQIGLEVSEIEGDAILFYKFGEPLELQALYKQVEKMFCDFHQHLAAYEHRRFCQCKACVSAANLTLKVITHYGEFTGYNVRNFNKLIGRDVIVAHQLLKNDIDQHEYWLVTSNLVQNGPPSGPEQWMQWNSSSKQTESGEIAYHYTQLGLLKSRIPENPDPRLEIPDKIKMVSASKVYDTDIKTLFYTTVHFELRNQWRVGVKAIDEIDHLLPGVGTRHRCVLDNGEVLLYTSSFSYNPDEKIVFSETDERKEQATYYILEKIDEQHTRFTLERYVQKNIVRQLLFRLTKQKQLEREFRQSLHNLETLVKTIRLPLAF